jgi:hypothetical protein
LLLTYNPVYETSKFSSPELYENIVVKDFIHRCYIEVSNYFKDNIELIIKDRKREIHHIIKDCIEHSIKKSISNYDEIIKEYLKIKFDISKKEDRMSYDNIKSMVSRMIDTQKYGSVGGGGGADGVSVSGSGGESSFNNVENFINANKELDAIVKNSYIDGSGGGDSTKSAQQLSGKNYILNTQSNENSTTMQLQEATSNIINVGINKDKEIDNILNNNLEPINEEVDVGVVKEVNVVKEGGHNAHARVFSLTSTSINDDKTFINDDKTSINDDKTSINDDKTSINDDKTYINDKTSINEGTNKTSLLESPMPIRNNKINDILPTVKKGRPSKNKNADKFFNNLA